MINKINIYEACDINIYTGFEPILDINELFIYKGSLYKQIPCAVMNMEKSVCDSCSFADSICPNVSCSGRIFKKVGV